MATKQVTYHFASGAKRTMPCEQTYPVCGLDDEGRIVLDMGGYRFGLTLCCNAFDKGTSTGVCCRACYGRKSSDTGRYDAEVVDPVITIEMVVNKYKLTPFVARYLADAPSLGTVNDIIKSKSMRPEHASFLRMLANHQ